MSYSEYTNMLGEFLIRKATPNLIRKVLDKEYFIYTKKVVSNLLKGNQKGIRYGNIVLSRTEGGENHSRFFKVIIDGKRQTYRLFRRQIEMSKALDADNNFIAPTMKVIKSSFKPPLPYAIFETHEDGEGFGFMHDTPSEYERLTKKEVWQIVKTLYSFHLSGFDIDAKVLKHTQKIPFRLGYYKKEFSKSLNKKITHRTKDGTELRKTVKELLEQYTHISGIHSKLANLLESAWKYVHLSESSDGYYLVHSDMQIDNIYKHKDGAFELIDFEWVGRSRSPIIAIMYDYGNIRVRAWSSPKFQKLLDEAIKEIGFLHYKNKKLIETAINLGIVRSSLKMSRFYMDFENTIKKDKRTEEEYYKMYPRTIAALAQVLA